MKQINVLLLDSGLAHHSTSQPVVEMFVISDANQYIGDEEVLTGPVRTFNRPKDNKALFKELVTLVKFYADAQAMQGGSPLYPTTYVNTCECIELLNGPEWAKSFSFCRNHFPVIMTALRSSGWDITIV